MAILLDVPTDDIEGVLRERGLLVEGARGDDTDDTDDADGPELRVVRDDEAG